jgi:DNA-binding NtrC family response regulator
MPDSAPSIPSASGDELRTILLVDAEVVVRTPLADFLRDCGLTVFEVSDAEEAKTVLLEGGVAVDVVLCDVVTIGAMEGFAFSHWVKARLPDIPVLLAGSLDKAASIARDLCDEAPSLARPYDPSLVLEAMRRALASRQRVSSDDTA